MKKIKHKKIIIGLILVTILGFFIWHNFINTSSQQPQYQTAIVQKGTLVKTVSASGQITSANNVQITIQASGLVKDVLVKNGDDISEGQTIATLTLDQASQQKQAQAYASYLSAKNSLAAATAKLNSLPATEFNTNQKFMNDAVVRGLTTNDPTYIQENANWLQAEADYKNQSDVIIQSQASLASASLALSQVSSTVTAPVSGKLFGLTITPGAIITLSSSSNSTSTSQVLGSISQAGKILAQVNLSEIDSVNVSEGQKTTLTMDAFPNKTFTGKVVSINTNGVVSSSVTTYPAIISFDSAPNPVYPNMGVNANVITKIKDNVLLTPNGTVQTQNGQTSARVLKNDQVQTINIEVGDSSDTQTEIISGLSEGDTVVTGTPSAAQGNSSGQNSSPFGGGRNGVFRTISGGGR